MKVVPNPDSKIPYKHIENIFSFEEEHFGIQAIKLKRLYQQYNCRVCMLDGNGLGIGLVDFLVTDQEDPDTGKTLYNWGVINDEDDKYRKFETEDTVRDALYIVKMNRNTNSELYSYVQTQFMSGKIRFLIPSKIAEDRLMQQENSKFMTKLQREEYLMPFRQTDFLKNQVLNLVEKEDVGVIVLTQANSRVKKDKFSAFIYALLWTKMEEEKAGRKKSVLGDFVFFSAQPGQNRSYNFD